MMIYHLYMSAGAALLCAFIVVVLKFISISKMRLGNRDQKRKVRLSTMEVLTLLRNMKPFPIGTHTGWKLNSFQYNVRVWTQLLHHTDSDVDLPIYGAYTKVRIPAQLVLQILNDVSKTTSWKPGCLATSITSKQPEPETGIRLKRMMGGVPVQHDDVMEESSLNIATTGLFMQCVQFIWMLLGQNNAPHTFTKEHRRYWHREDNGVCWHLQMSERHQEWLFFLAQPVEAVDKCLLTVVGYNENNQGAKHIAEILASLSEYIRFRKLLATPLVDIKLPSDKVTEPLVSTTSSSDEAAYYNPGKRMLLRFRSLVEKPTHSAEKLHGAKKQLVKSASILHHRTMPFLDLPDTVFKTRSLDRTSANFSPNLSPRHQNSVIRPRSHSLKDSERPKVKENEDTQSVISMPNLEPADEVNSVEDNNNQKVDVDNNIPQTVERSDIISVSEESEMSESAEAEKDIDKILQEDVNNFEESEESASDLTDSKDTENIQQMVTANHTAAELLAMAVQVSNIDLSQSIKEQVVNTGGWMFCGLDNDVVVLKKIALQESVHCYLGKGVIQASPASVWNAIRNPRTKFTYDDSLKKVDVLETLSDSIKVVYYYHEVLQLFKKECCDMVVVQSEKHDGDKYVLAMLSSDVDVACPEGTVRVKVLPSGWIIEPVIRDKKVYSMATYIMQIDFGNVKQGIDKTPFEDLVAKQPRSISYLRQYLRPSAIWAEKGDH